MSISSYFVYERTVVHICCMFCTSIHRGDSSSDRAGLFILVQTRQCWNGGQLLLLGRI